VSVHRGRGGVKWAAWDEEVESWAGREVMVWAEVKVLFSSVFCFLPFSILVFFLFIFTFKLQFKFKCCGEFVLKVKIPK
jgi:hypothetical protein